VKAIAVAFVIVVSIAGAYLLGARTQPFVAPIIYLDDNVLLLYDHADEIKMACPGASFSLAKGESDYWLSMSWHRDRWTSLLLRKDSVLMMRKDSPDFLQIVREACKDIQADKAWLVENRPSRHK
jgi:hypothetical protein